MYPQVASLHNGTYYGGALMVVPAPRVVKFGSGGPYKLFKVDIYHSSPFVLMRRRVMKISYLLLAPSSDEEFVTLTGKSSKLFATKSTIRNSISVPTNNFDAVRDGMTPLG